MGRKPKRKESFDLPDKEVMEITKAVSKAFPMIVCANLTKNTYTLIKNENFLYSDIPSNGVYDDMIDDGVVNIHPNYQEMFLQCFSREHLTMGFKNGKNEVYAEMYQKDKEGTYHWVSSHVIRIDDPSGDMVEVCFCRVIEEMEYHARGNMGTGGRK